MPPAMIATGITASAPNRATTGTSTTAMAPRRPGHLDVRATEDAGHQSGHDGGDEPGGRSDPGRHPERQRQRQGDDAHGDAGEHVGAPAAPEPGVVGRLRQHPLPQHVEGLAGAR